MEGSQQIAEFNASFQNPPINNNHRNAIAVQFEQLRVAANIDLGQIEVDLASDLLEHLASLVAQVAASFRIEGHLWRGLLLLPTHTLCSIVVPRASLLTNEGMVPAAG